MVQSVPTSAEDGSDMDKQSGSTYSTIRDRIVSLELPPGSLLSENSLGASLGLSRTPIREAIKRLEREYLVAILPRRGIVVTEVDLKSQLDLLEFRRGIEIRLIRRGTVRASDAQRRRIGEIAEVVESCAKTGDLSLYIKSDTDFDTLIEQAADNRFLTDAMRPVHALVRRFWHTQRGRSALPDALQQHARVIRAAAGGAPDRVDAELTTLYDINERYIRSLIA